MAADRSSSRRQEIIRLKREAPRACFFIIALLLLRVAEGEALSQERVREKESKPLRIELSTPAATLCPGSSISLEVQLTNQSQETIRIDKADMWSSFAYGTEPVIRLDGSGYGRYGGGGMVSGCDHCRGDYIVIAPGETIWSKHDFQLERDFFRDAGKYSLKTQVKYELADKKDLTLDSNEIKFELFECVPK